MWSQVGPVGRSRGRFAMLRVVVGVDAEQLVDGDESIALLDEGVGGQLDGADGLGPESDAAVEPVVEDQDGAWPGLGDGTAGDAGGVGLKYLKRVGEHA